jgi:hypothetical protein
MAAEITDITQRNQMIPEDIAGRLEHILTDLHDAVRMLHDQGRILARHDALLAEFRPLLDQFRSPLASAITLRRNRGRK